MKAVVHIGTPKAGSSTIQEFLMANSKVLAKQGFCYNRRYSHRLSQYELPLIAYDHLKRPFVSESKWDRTAVGDQARLTSEAVATHAYLSEVAKGTAHTALFSSEHLFAWLEDRELIEAFDQAMHRYFDEVTYVAYFRAPLSFIVSLYSESLKCGSRLNLDQFIEKRKTLKGYYGKPIPWANAIESDRLKARLLDRDHLEKGDLITDFCRTVGVDHTACIHPEPQNESLSYVGAEMLRALNVHVPVLRADGSFNEDRDGYLPEILHRTAGEAPLRLNARQAETVRAAAGPYVTTFLNRYFPEIDTLFPDKSTTNTEVNHQAVLRRALVHLSALFLERAGKPVNEAALAPPQEKEAAHTTGARDAQPTAQGPTQSASKQLMLKLSRALRALGRFRMRASQKGWK